MYKPKLISIVTVLVGVAAASVPATSFAGTPPSQDCLLREHRITSVTPYRVEERIGKNSVRRLRGAEVFVQAEPGLTAEWLQLTLARHIAQMRGPAAMPDCAFDVDDVAVRVESGRHRLPCADHRARHRQCGRGVASCAAAPFMTTMEVTFRLPGS